MYFCSGQPTHFCSGVDSLMLRYKTSRVFTHFERDDFHTATNGETNFLLRPKTRRKSWRVNRDKGFGDFQQGIRLHTLQSGFGINPLTVYCDVRGRINFEFGQKRIDMVAKLGLQRAANLVDQNQFIGNSH
jgi:hypothetical protein